MHRSSEDAGRGRQHQSAADASLIKFQKPKTAVTVFEKGLGTLLVLPLAVEEVREVQQRLRVFRIALQRAGKQLCCTP